MQKTLQVSDKKYQNQALFQAALRDFQIGLHEIYGEKQPEIVLYGSYARNEARADSDIDILLLFAETIQPGKELTRLSYLLADLNLRYEVLVSVVPATQMQFQRADGPFWKNVRQEGIPINVA